MCIFINPHHPSVKKKMGENDKEIKGRYISLSSHLQSLRSSLIITWMTGYGENKGEKKHTGEMGRVQTNPNDEWISYLSSSLL